MFSLIVVNFIYFTINYWSKLEYKIVVFIYVIWMILSDDPCFDEAWGDSIVKPTLYLWYCLFIWTIKFPTWWNFKTTLFIAISIMVLNFSDTQNVWFLISICVFQKYIIQHFPIKVLPFTTMCTCWRSEGTCIYTLLVTPGKDGIFILQPVKLIYEMFHYLAIQKIKPKSNAKNYLWQHWKYENQTFVYNKCNIHAQKEVVDSMDFVLSVYRHQKTLPLFPTPIISFDLMSRLHTKTICRYITMSWNYRIH